MARNKHPTNKKDGPTFKQKFRRKKTLQPLTKVRVNGISPVSEKGEQLPALDSKKNLGEISLPKSIHNGDRSFQPSNITFSPNERILLVGEADLSFAYSLIKHYGCCQVTATVYESELDLKVKYPHVEDNIRLIETTDQAKIRYSFDATNAKLWQTYRKSNFSRCFDKIIFNFPHVGGKSKDVNRQVRYNQELLVSFFKNAIPCLSPTHSSSIIVTLFEGEPYTLWNVRDLARHSGLEVAQSFSFEFSLFPGYKHSRTLGILRTKSGKESSGWKGEDRPARTFVFVRKGEGQIMGIKRKNDQNKNEEEDLF
ncbi:putative prodicted protein [Erysiphe necator]|uniref:Putative prodicted protein n=1 Tax=Uncinula necator TaxID=52586 RepID=A0A0B1PCQ2_UNCNE|nr:putative prodicted protein [Erysiphe necator]